MPDLIDFATASLTQVTDALDELRKQASEIFDAHKVEGKFQAEKVTKEENEKLVDINVKLAEAQTRWEELTVLEDGEKKIARLSEFLDKPVGEPPVLPKGEKREPWQDAGKMFAESDGLKAYLEDGTKDREVEVPLHAFNPRVGAAIKAYGYLPPGFPFAGGQKATLGTDNTLVDVDVEFPPEVTRDSRIGVINTLAQPPNIADLMIQVSTDQNAIKYMNQTTRTSGAVETAEGALAGEASYEWAEVTDPIRKIIHIFPVTDETLADNGFLRGIVNSEMLLGVTEREDLQLLKGDGVGQNIDGINNRTGVQNVNRSLTAITGQNYAEALHSGIVLVRKQFRVPSAIVQSQTTFAFVELAKDSQNQYLFARTIQDAAIPRIWGLPVALNENQSDYDTIGNIGSTVGAFASDAYVVRRTGVELSVSDSHSDFFGRDTLTLKARERVGLAVTRAAAFVTITSIV